MRQTIAYSILCMALFLGGCGPNLELEETAPDAEASQNLAGEESSDPRQLEVSISSDHPQTFCGMHYKVERTDRRNIINFRLTRVVSKVACDETATFTFGDAFHKRSISVSTVGTATAVAERISGELTTLKRFHSSVETVKSSNPTLALNEAVIRIFMLP